MAETNLGRFIWVELSTTDTAAAKQFYPRVTGWRPQEYPEGAMEYTVWMNGDAGVGGLMQLPQHLRQQGVPPHWLGYVYVSDLDATVARAKDMGGILLAGPEEVPNVGRWAVLHDPQGATITAMRPYGPDRAPAPPAVGEFSWHELATTDPDAAFAFYAELFGWERMQDHDMGPAGVYTIFGLGGDQLGGIFRKPAEMPGPPWWLHYVRVADADEAARRVTAAGGTVANGPMDVPDGGRVAQCQDPQGAFFAVHASARIPAS